MYEIGEKIWYSGDELEIIGEPYSLHGGMWQDAKKENGEIIPVITKEENEKDLKKRQKQWKEQQDGFRKVRETLKEGPAKK